MATYYVELNGGELSPKTTLKGGGLVPSVSFAGAVIYPSSGGGGANLETKSVSYTPSETAISDTLLPDPGYDGFDEVDVSVGAIPSNYVGSAIDRIGESDITVSGSSVTMPEGYYPNEMVASIPSAPLPTLSSATINNSGTLQVVANLSSDGYLPSGNLPLTLENAFTVKGAQTYTPGTTDQSISADQYLTGNQTILGDANLLPENIKKDVTIFGQTGTYEGGGATDYLANRLNNTTYSYSSDAVTQVREYALRGSTALTSLSLPNCTSIGNQSMYGCTNLVSVYFPNVTSIGGYALYGCTKLEMLVLPKFTSASTATNRFQGCSRLATVDLRVNILRGADLADCTALTTLILRRTSVVTLPNVNALSGTPFKSDGTGGTIYVPQALLNTYPTATNWSTYNGYGTITWKAIEGSIYETAYADGTPIS